MNLSDVRQIRIWLQLIDGLLAATAMVAAYYIRVYWLPDILPLESREIGEFSLYFPYIVMMGVAAPLVLSRRGLYRHFSGRGRKANWAAMFEAGLILFLVGVSVIFFFKQSPSRIVFLLFVPLFFLLLLLREEVFYRFRLFRRQTEHYSVRLLLVTDSPDHSDRWINLFSDAPVGIRITRTFPAESGSIADFVEALHEDSAGIVLFDVGTRHMNWTAQAIKACEEEGIEAWLSTDFVGTQIARAQFEEIMNRNLLVFRSTRAGTWQSVATDCQVPARVERKTSRFRFMISSNWARAIWVPTKSVLSQASMPSSSHALMAWAVQFMCRVPTSKRTMPAESSCSASTKSAMDPDSAGKVRVIRMPTGASEKRLIQRSE